MRGFFGLALLAVLAGCTPKTQPAADSEDAARSPNATIMPAPLSSAPPTAAEADASLSAPVGIPADSRGRLILPEAGLPTPQALIAGQPVPPDPLGPRESSGLSLTAEWLWVNVPAPAHSPELALIGIETARKATHRLWTVELTETGRMRAVFDSAAFPLAKGTELRSRYDMYGHVLVWASGDQYRVVPPGALRALLDERRVDVTPLMAEKAQGLPSAGIRFGFPTSRMQVTTANGKLVIDQAHVNAAGLGGPVLCRTLLELVSTEPNASTCAPNLVPVHAEYSWPGGSSMQFDVVALNTRSDYQTMQLAVPPIGANFTPTGLPPNASGVLLTREQVAAFRSRPIDATHPRTDRESRGAPAEGMLAVNGSDALRFVLIDGVPVAWVPPHGRQYVIGTTRGRYLVQWRSFLGSFVGPAMTVEFPALVTLGEDGDAGN